MRCATLENPSLAALGTARGCPHFRRAIGLVRPLFDAQPSQIALNQYLSMAYQNQARSLHALSLDDESIEVTRELVKLWPRNAEILFDAARAFRRVHPRPQ